MATKKATDAPAVQPIASTPLLEESRREVVVAMAAALIQSPRFAARITDDRQQDLLVDISVRLADKLINATA